MLSFMHSLTNGHGHTVFPIDRTVTIICVTLACVAVGFAVHNWFVADPYQSKYIQEGLAQKKHLFLIGDSMLNNQLYVPDGDSVYHKVRDQTRDTVHLLAKDDAVISEMYSQLHKIPPHFDEKSTYLCVSAGGNDLLGMQSLIYTNSFKKDSQEEMDDIFKEYTKFISAIKMRLPDATLLLMNLYYPPSMPHLKTVVAYWNGLLSNTFSNDSVTKNIRVIEVDKVFTEPTDFVSRIEPSSEGGEKLSKLILDNIK
jgi:hypothetical protein